MIETCAIRIDDVEVAGARRFERVEEGDLELIRNATGINPS